MSSSYTWPPTGRAITAASNVRIDNFKTNLLTRLQGIEYYLSMEMDRRSQRLYGSVLCSSGAMQVFKLETLKKIGGYHTAPQVPEDMEITWRLHKEGKVEMNHEVVGYTAAPDTIKKLFFQRLQWMKLGVICMVLHRKGIFNRRYGMLGMIGIPIKVFMTLRSLIGVGVKGYTSFVLSWDHQVMSLLFLFLMLSMIQFSLDLLLIYLVRPVAKEKQGACQWFLLPFFSSVYQPIICCVRLIAIASAVNWLAAEQFRKRHRRPFVPKVSTKDIKTK
ncbi:MAG TPA: glycosyltransferase family 2 protein [Bacillales bacterium]|nr:glycosyltransferase family 2 protein [Bacillales bacterium]